jgi:hypothetical protein
VYLKLCGPTIPVGRSAKSHWRFIVMITLPVLFLCLRVLIMSTRVYSLVILPTICRDEVELSQCQCFKVQIQSLSRYKNL